MAIPGVVTYKPGEKVFVFLKRMPNQYLRTTGWSQGKFAVDAGGRIHAPAAPAGLQIVAAGASNTDSQLSGKTTAEVHAIVRARAARTAQ